MTRHAIQRFTAATAIVLLAFAVGCGDVDDNDDNGDTASGVYETDDGMVLDLQFDPDPPQAGEVDLMMDITLDGEAVEDADIEIEPWMPSHGHGANTDPVVHHQGDGHYHVDDLSFSMAGPWELTFDIEYNDEQTGVVVDVEVQ